MKIGTRLAYNGHLCTLRYIGPLDAWPNFTAYGVEWDDPSRGKHDGEHDGKKLFECRVEGSGSFLKSTKRFDKLSTFVEVVNDLYVNGEKLTNAVGGDLISIGSKVLEKVGFDKDINLMRLENISVSQRGVTDISYFYDLHIGKKHNAILAEALRQDKEKIQKLGLTNLKSLDLGYNLISDFSYVSHLISVFEETLESIILNGNRFEISFQIDDLRKSFENIHHLSLSATLVTNEDLQLLGHLFPKVKSLNLSMNQLQLEEIINLSHWTSLEMLDLSYNKLTATKLNQARLPSSLRKLNLSNNHIADRLLLPVSIMNNLLDLNISYNLISDWKCVEYLGCVNSELKNLRINNNPIYTRALAEQNSNTLPLKASVGMWDEVSYGDIHVLARWSSIALERLNGRAITPLDKQDAELYFISKVSNRFIRIEDFDPLNSNRWKELAAKYGVQMVHQNGTKHNATIGSKLINLVVDYKTNIEVPYFEDYKISIKKRVLKNTSIQKIKGMICKSINSEISRVMDSFKEKHQTKDYPEKLFLMVSPLDVKLWVNDDLRINDETRFLDFYGIKDGDRLILRNSTI